MRTNKPFNYHISYVFSLFNDHWLKIGAFLQLFNAASSLPSPSDFVAQRKEVLWLGSAINMRA
jgi:hypothetical protein